MYPGEVAEGGKAKGKLRLMYELAPLSMIAEQAGGRGSTGKRRILDIAPAGFTSGIRSTSAARRKWRWPNRSTSKVEAIEVPMDATNPGRRCRWNQNRSRALQVFGGALELVREHRYATAKFDSLEAVCAEFLGARRDGECRVPRCAGADHRRQRACHQRAVGTLERRAVAGAEGSSGSPAQRSRGDRVRHG